MTYTRSAIGLLTRQYRSVLKKCFLINMGLFALGAVSAADVNAAAPTPTLDDMNTKAASFTPSQQYTLETTQGTNTHFLLLDNGSGTLTQYWYTPAEGTVEKNNILNYLAGVSLIETTSTTDYVFTNGTKYYTFDMDKPRPASSYTYTGDTVDTFAFKNSESDIATFTTGASDNYDVKVSLNKDTTKYYNINIDLTKASHVGSRLSNINWSTTAPDPEVYTWADDYVAGSNVTISGDNITGAIRLKTSHNGIVLSDDSYDKWFTYKYTKPNSDWTITTTTINLNDDGSNAQNKIFARQNTVIYYNAHGGVINNNEDKPNADIVADFINNSISSNTSSEACGGAIYSSRSIHSIRGNFIANRAISSIWAGGGAIYSNRASIQSIVGDFIGNSANSSNAGGAGGAIMNYDGEIREIVGNFIGNIAKQRSGNGSYSPSGGGAIHNHKYGLIESITGNFISNSTNSTGGAIDNGGKINTIIGNFIGNNAYNTGGAVISTGNIGSIVGDFIGNSAGGGGAIVNSGKIGTIVGDFIGNRAVRENSSGGAISGGKIGSIVGDFIGNSAGSGGAINSGTYGSIVGDFIGNSANSFGGAIRSSTIKSISGNFINNKANSIGGAISGGTYDSIIGDFIGNSANSSGGAIYGGIYGSIVGDFINNSAGSGGAIYNKGGTVNNSIKGSFINNSANSSGGAICNEGYSEEYYDEDYDDWYTDYNTAIISSILGDFINNSVIGSANVYGGAIYIVNSGASSRIDAIEGDFIENFVKSTTNIDSIKGGAIYNNGGSVTLSGNTFTDNYIDNNGTITPNSIYNAGTINIADGKTVTINDGYDGTSSGKLNIGTSADSGSVFNLSVDNGEIQTDNLGTVTNNGTINWDLDVDLLGTYNTASAGTPTSDNILTTSISGTNSIIIRAINLMTDKKGTTEVAFASGSPIGAYILSATINDNIYSPGGLEYTVTYDNTTGILTFNGDTPLILGDATIDTVHKASKEYLALDSDSHAQYTSLVETKDDDHPDVVVLNNKVYYFKANESAQGSVTADEMNVMVRNLAATGANAWKEVESTENWIFQAGDKYYTYDKKKLPISAYTLTQTDSPTHWGITLPTWNETTQTYENKTYDIVLKDQGAGSQDIYYKWSVTGSNTNRKLVAGSSESNDFIIKTYSGTGNTDIYLKWTADGYGNRKLTATNVNIDDYDLFASANTGDGDANVYLKWVTDEPVDKLTISDESNYNFIAKYNASVNTTKTGAIDLGDISLTSETSPKIMAVGASKNSKDSIISISDTLFINNTVTGTAVSGKDGKSLFVFGGALSNEGIIDSITADFVGNGITMTKSGTFYNHTITSMGGAIGNYSTSSENGKIGSITGNFIGNYVSKNQENVINKGGAIYNHDGFIGNITGNFIGNYALSSLNAMGGGAIYNTGTITSILGDFVGNYASGSSSVSGGAVYNSGIINSITGDFIKNFAKNRGSSGYQDFGGAIYNSGTIGNITGDFINNYSRWNGGAIYNTGSIDHIAGSFIGNYGSIVTGKRGAIYNSGTINSITGDFLENQKSIYNAGTIGIITGNFIKNYESAYNGASSSRECYGGAIKNTNIIDSVIGNFIGNSASTYAAYYKYYVKAMGGAVYNSDGALIKNITGDFIDNYAITFRESGSASGTAYAGAIYAHNIGTIVGDFVGNYTNSNSGSSYGGAIYAYNVDNITGDFIGNYTYSNLKAIGGAISGAISAAGTINSVTGNFIGNYAKTTSDTDKAYGGAIFNGNISSDLPSYNANSRITLAGNTFTSNYVQEGTNDPIPNSIYNAGVINIKNGATVTVNDGYDGLGVAQLNVGTSETSGSTFNLSVDNGVLQTDNLGTVTNNGTINWDLDVGLVAKNSDKITVNSLSGTQSIIIRAINLITGTGSDQVDVTLTTNDTLKLAYKLADDFNIGSDISKATGVDYDVQSVTYNPQTGILTFNGASTLVKMIAKNAANKEYTIPNNGETVEANLATLVNNKITVLGNNTTDKNFVKGSNNYNGVTLGTGNDNQTFEVKNVAEWSGFTSPAITTGAKGTLNIENSHFSGNATADINNGGTMNLTGTNSFEKIIGDGTTELKSGTTTVSSLAQGTLTVTSGATLDNTDVATVSGGSNAGTINGALSNSGTFNNSGSIQGDVTNTGTMTSSANNLGGAIANNDGGTLNLSGALAKTISGTGTTKVDSALTLNAGAEIAGTLDMNSGTVDMSGDSKYTNYDIGSMSNSGSVKIDAKAETQESDKINTSAASTNANLTISALNLDVSGFTEGVDYTQTMHLVTGNTNGVSIAFGSGVDTPYNQSGIVISDKTGTDSVTDKDVLWEETFGSWKQSGTKSTSLTLNGTDMIYSITNTYGPKVYTSNSEGLKELNQFNAGSNVKTYNASTTGTTHTVIEDLGSTVGKVSIDGKGGTLNFNNHQGFVMGSGTEVTLKDVTAKNSTKLAEVASGATLSLQNVTLENNGALPNDGTLNLSGTNSLESVTGSGTTELNGGTTTVGSLTQGTLNVASGATLNNTGVATVSGGSNAGTIQGAVSNSGTFNNSGSIQGDVTNTGTMTSSANNLGGAIANNDGGTLNLSGTLAKTISGTGTTKVDSALTLNSGANVAGTVDMNAGAVTVSTGAITSHNVGEIKGTGNIVLDIDYSGSDIVSDEITVTTDTENSTLKITTLNETGTRQANFEKQILFGTNGKTKLDISAITGTWNTSTDKEAPVSLTTNTIAYNDNYGTHKWTETTELSVIGSQTGLYDTLKYTTTISNDRYDPKAENLTVINQYSGSGSDDRKIDFTGIQTSAAAGTYTMKATTSLGTTTAGKMTLDGEKSSTGALTVVNLNGNAGYNLTNATELVLDEVKLTGASGNVITATNDNASVKLHDAYIDGDIVKSGGNKMNVSTSGTTTLDGDTTNVNLSNSGDLTNNGAITGDVGNTGTFTNNSTISGDVTNTGTMTSSANNLGGAIANNDGGTLNLSGTLAKTVSGTGTTKVDSALTLNSDANVAGTVDMNAGAVTVSTGAITSHNVGEMKNNGSIAIDINYGSSGITSDEIHLTSDDYSSVLTISALTESGTRPTDFEKQILFGTNGKTTLALSDDVLSQFNKTHDAVNKNQKNELTSNTTSYKDKYGTEYWTEYYDRTLSVVSSASGSSDSIKYESVKTSETAHTWNPEYDTLALMNQYDGTSYNDRSIDFSGIHEDTGGVYALSDDLGTTTAGTFTLNGEIISGDLATVDLGTHDGFALTNATELVLDKVKLTGGSNDEVITATNDDASVKLHDAYIDGDIVNNGSNKMNVSTSGTTTLNGATTNVNLSNSGDLTNNGAITGDVGNTGTFTNNSTISGDVTNTGTMTSSANNLGGAIANNSGGTLNLSGALAKTISGTGTTKVDSALTLNAEAEIAGTLDMNNGEVDMSGNDAYNTYNIGSLSNDGLIKIDAKAATEESDKINTSAASTNANLTISALNLDVNGLTEGVDYVQTMHLVEGNTNGVSIAFGDGVDTPYNQTGIVISDKTGTDSVTDKDVTWDETFGDWKKSGTKDTTLTLNGTDMVYTVTNTYGPKVYTSNSEGLKELNQFDAGEKTKTFNASSEGTTHTVTEDLGSTVGKVSIDGKGGTLDFDGHKGFEMGSGTEVTLKDVTAKNANKLADVKNGATLNLENVTLKDNGLLQNAGTINLNGTNSIDSIIAGTSTSATLNVNSDWEMDTTVTGHQVNVNGAKLTVGAGKLIASDSLTAKDGAEIAVADNKINLDQVKFESGSKLSLKVNSLDSFGGIEANNITVENGANLSATLAHGIVKIGQRETLQLLKADNTNFNNFADSFDNNMYVFEKADQNGAYLISQIKTAEEISREDGGTETEAHAAGAWVDGDTFNQGSTAAEVADALADLAQNDANGLNEALAVVTPQEAPDVQAESTELTDKLLLTVDKHLSNQDIGGLSSGDLLRDVSLWAKGYYGKSKLSDNGKVRGFDTKNKGVIAGIDKKVTSAVKLGFGIQYNDSDIDAFHRDVEVDTLTGFIYGEYRPSKWFINGVASFGKSDYDEKKYALGKKITDNYSANVYSLQGLTGYDFKYVTPEIGARYYRIKRHGYEDSIEQKVSGKDMDLLRGLIGVHSSHSFGIFKPEIYAGITYDFVSDEDNAIVSLPNGSSYAVDGKRMKRFGTEFSASVTVNVNDNTSVLMGYEGKFRSHFQDHTGIVNLKYEF